MVEAQIDYVVDALRVMDKQRAGTVEVRADVQKAFNAELEKRHQGTVWTAGGCQSWYLTADGRNPTIWPGWTYEYWWRTRRFRSQDYTLEPAT
jgi:hypothetical protein